MKRPAPPGGSNPRRDAGVTLLELVVAMALFAMVALIGMQALRLSLRYQDDLARVSAEQAQLETALGLLRHDLEAALQIAPDARARRTELPLLLAGVPLLEDPARSVLAEVRWSYDPVANHLLRAALNDPDQGAPQVILTGVNALDIALLSDTGWVLPQEAGPTPRGYEIRLDTTRGPLRIVVIK